jgi:uracil-DNA glycosylase
MKEGAAEGSVAAGRVARRRALGVHADAQVRASVTHNPTQMPPTFPAGADRGPIPARAARRAIAIRDASADPDLDALLVAARACRACAGQFGHEPRPVVQAASSARILVVGQAPGARVHASGVPWDDRSGDRLRDWMGIGTETFHDATRVAIVPVGLCYPGKAASGDRPPPRTCAPLWLDRLRPRLTRVELTLLVGAHAQAHVLGRAAHASVTETLLAWRQHAPRTIPLPHPSPRNIAWFKANPWFEDELLPVLRRAVRRLVGPRAA